LQQQCGVLGVVVVVVVVVIIVIVVMVMPLPFLLLPLLSLHCNCGGGAAAGGSMVLVLLLASSCCPLLLLPPLPPMSCSGTPPIAELSLPIVFCHPGDVVPIFPGAICMGPVIPFVHGLPIMVGPMMPSLVLVKYKYLKYNETYVNLMKNIERNKKKLIWGPK
jgi:hypothetical protein